MASLAEVKVRQSDCEEALRTAKDLLKKLEDQTEWEKDDEKKLSKLTKIVAILSKLIPLAEKNSTSEITFNSKEDEEIIRNFLARQKPAPKKAAAKKTAKKPVRKVVKKTAKKSK